ncbi:MAG: class I SAM-dependent methyltransferase [Candidatus Odinarchaeota archaeon]
MEEHYNNYDKKKKIIEKYNSSSHFYDKRYGIIQEEKYKIVLDQHKLKRTLILDMGCGTGLFLEYIKKHLIFTKGFKINYVGVDISWNMLKEFKSKIFNYNYRIYNPNLILSDIDWLPFRDDIFFSIFALTSFQNLPEIKHGIRELYRVSKNNAELNFSILKKKIDLKSLLELFKTKLKGLIVINNENLEDIVIEGRLLKD